MHTHIGREPMQSAAARCRSTCVMHTFIYMYVHTYMHTHIGREPMQSGAARRAAGSAGDVDLRCCKDDLYEKTKSNLMKRPQRNKCGRRRAPPRRASAAARGDVTDMRDIWRENLAGEFGGRLKRRGRQVIASPTECCYLDFDLGVTDLEQAYSFRPIPAQVPELNSPVLFSP